MAVGSTLHNIGIEHRVGVFSLPGRKRKQGIPLNLDAYFADPATGVFAIASGSPECSGGNAASAIAIEAAQQISRHVSARYKEQPNFPSVPEERNKLARYVASIVEAANGAIFSDGHNPAFPYLQNMETYFSLAVLLDRHLLALNVGGNRIISIKQDYDSSMPSEMRAKASLISPNSRAREDWSLLHYIIFMEDNEFAGFLSQIASSEGGNCYGYSPDALTELRHYRKHIINNPVFYQTHPLGRIFGHALGRIPSVNSGEGVYFQARCQLKSIEPCEDILLASRGVWLSLEDIARGIRGIKLSKPKKGEVILSYEKTPSTAAKDIVSAVDSFDFSTLISCSHDEGMVYTDVGNDTAEKYIELMERRAVLDVIYSLHKTAEAVTEKHLLNSFDFDLDHLYNIILKELCTRRGVSFEEKRRGIRSHRQEWEQEFVRRFSGVSDSTAIYVRRHALPAEQARKFNGNGAVVLNASNYGNNSPIRQGGISSYHTEITAKELAWMFGIVQDLERQIVELGTVAQMPAVHPDKSAVAESSPREKELVKAYLDLVQSLANIIEQPLTEAKSITVSYTSQEVMAKAEERSLTPLPVRNLIERLEVLERTYRSLSMQQQSANGARGLYFQWADLVNVVTEVFRHLEFLYDQMNLTITRHKSAIGEINTELAEKAGAFSEQKAEFELLTEKYVDLSRNLSETKKERDMLYKDLENQVAANTALREEMAGRLGRLEQVLQDALYAAGAAETSLTNTVKSYRTGAKQVRIRNKKIVDDLRENIDGLRKRNEELTKNLEAAKTAAAQETESLVRSVADTRKLQIAAEQTADSLREEIRVYEKELAELRQQLTVRMEMYRGEVDRLYGEVGERDRQIEELQAKYQKLGSLAIVADASDLVGAGIRYKEAGEYEIAQAYLAKALAKNPADLKTKYYLGSILCLAGQKEEAGKIFGELRTDAEKSGNFPLLLDLGKHYQANGEPDAAKACYMLAHKLNSSSVDAQICLAELFYQQKKITLAKSWLEMARSTNSEDGRIKDLSEKLY